MIRPKTECYLVYGNCCWYSCLNKIEFDDDYCLVLLLAAVAAVTGFVVTLIGYHLVPVVVVHYLNINLKIRMEHFISF